MNNKEAMDEIKALYCGDYDCLLPDNRIDDSGYYCDSEECKGCIHYLCHSALQEKLARESGCEYCMGDDPMELLGMGEYTVFLFVDRFHNGECELNWTHCPMCGRELGEATC